MSTHKLTVEINLPEEITDSDVASALGEMVMLELDAISVEISDDSGGNLFQDDNSDED